MSIVDNDYRIAECGAFEHSFNMARIVGDSALKEMLSHFTKTVWKDERKSGVYYQDEYLHKLAVDYVNKKISAKDAIKKSKIYLKSLLSKSEEVDWNMLIATINANSLGNIINEHDSNIPNDAYWKMVAHAYTMSNMCYEDADNILPYFKNNRPDKHFLMNDEELAALAALPDTFTIYRGCSKKEISAGKFRFSWTTDRKVAEYFAFEYINGVKGEIYGKKKIELYDVVEKTINKQDVVAYFLGRKEAEIIYISTKY